MSEANQTATTAGPGDQPVEPDWSLGWRHELVRDARGQERSIRVPLTAEEAARVAAQARIAELEAQLQRLQQC